MEENNKLYVIKRNGESEEIKFDAITERLNYLINISPQLKNIDPALIAKKVIEQIVPGIKTVELDNYSAEVAAYLSSKHFEYGLLAGRIIASSIEKETPKKFSEAVKRLYNNKYRNKQTPLCSKNLYDIVMKNKQLINNEIVNIRNYQYDFFAYRTLTNNYLIKDSQGILIETIQYMFMRISIGIHSEDFESVFKTYHLMSEKFFIHATPTLFNAGTNFAQMSSCFLEGTKVLTINNGIKNIENVNINDYVVTHKGNNKLVKQIHKNPLNSRFLYDIKCFLTPNFTVTDNHKFMSIKKIDLSTNLKPSWNSIEDLQVGDFISIPNKKDENLLDNLQILKINSKIDLSDFIPFYKEKNPDSKCLITDEMIEIFDTYHNVNQIIPRYIEKNEDFCKFLGSWIDNGIFVCEQGSEKNPKIGGILFKIKKENPIKNFYESYCKKFFGDYAGSFYKMDNNNGDIDFIIESKFFAQFFIFNYTKIVDKNFFKILPNESFSWSRNMVKSFIIGLFSNYEQNINNEFFILPSIHNKELGTHIYHLSRQYGILISYENIINENGKSHFSLQIIKNDPYIIEQLLLLTKYNNDDGLPINSSKYIKIDENYLVRINSKSTNDKNPEFVYTLGIEDDHSYSIEGLVTENCFLLTMKEDSIDGIYETLKNCALISKSAGGIGLSIHNIRSKSSYIKGTNGYSNGIVPMLRVFNDTARYVDQCFPGETIIYTQQGPKKMENIEKNDKVLTHTGNFQKVNKIIKYNKEEKLINIFFDKNLIENIKLTGEHPLFVLTNTNKLTNLELQQRLNKNMIFPIWLEANKLKDGDYVCFPIFTEKIDLIDWDEEDCRIYGIICTQIYSNLFIDWVRINSCKKETIEFCEKYFQNKQVLYYTSQGYKGIQYKISQGSYEFKNIDFKINEKLSKIMNNELIYDLKNKERIIHSSFINLPIEKSISLLKGLFELNSYNDEKYIYLNIISKNILENIQYMLSCLGIISYKYHCEDCKQNICECFLLFNYFYKLKIPLTKQVIIIFNIQLNNNIQLIEDSFIYEGFLFTKIFSILECDLKKEDLYDYEIEKDHSYVTNFTIAHNGGGKRKGSFAIYLEPWHKDIIEFLNMKNEEAKEEFRALDLFYALWIPDLFMKRVENDENWTLFCPTDVGSLAKSYGEEFEKLYIEYESKPEIYFGIQIKARKIWFIILKAQIETGTPYVLYKDACNMKSNQKNIGTIQSSNLCTEIIQYSSPDEIAVCLTGDTKIVTKNGLFRIDQCDNKKVLVPFISDENLNYEQHFELAKLIYNGFKKVYKLKLNNSREIKATENHKFLIINNETDKFEWKTVEQLKIGDKLYSPSIKVLPSYDINILHCVNSECLEMGYNIDENYSNNSNFMETFSYKIEKLSPINLASFISGLFSKNGFVDFGESNPSILLNFKDEKFLFEIQSLLYCFGIRSEINLINFNEENDNYSSLIISTTEDIKNFAKRISFCSSKEKLEVLNDILDFGILEKSRNYFIIHEKIQCQEEEKVYDLYIPKGHHFIANNIVTHNCNLASISLPKFVMKNNLGNEYFDHEKLHEITKVIVYNLNKIIDKNYYPLIEAKNSNLKHRPIGIGIQGLANVFILFKLPYESEEARKIHDEIFETIYHGSLEASCELAEIDGSYSTFEGSPFSKGILQFDMWNHKPKSGRFDWLKMRERVKKRIRNSLLTTCMPTASTSQILGNVEMFEPITSNIYSRQTLSGSFIVIIDNLIKDLIELGLWNNTMKDKIILNEGSIQNIENIPQSIKNIYKTIWEISPKYILDLAADRAVYLDQSMSLNCFMSNPNIEGLSKMHFYGWKKGLKTGMYYLRTKAKIKPTNSSNSLLKLSNYSKIEDKKESNNINDQFECKLNDINCTTCSS